MYRRLSLCISKVKWPLDRASDMGGFFYIVRNFTEATKKFSFGYHNYKLFKTCINHQRIDIFVGRFCFGDLL
jgi:hypothetical protein